MGFLRGLCTRCPLVGVHPLGWEVLNRACAADRMTVMSSSKKARTSMTLPVGSIRAGQGRAGTALGPDLMYTAVYPKERRTALGP